MGLFAQVPINTTNNSFFINEICLDINECNPGNVNNCSANAVCSNNQGSYSCACKIGYSGTGFTCSGTISSYYCLVPLINHLEDIDECKTGFVNNCSSQASCTNTQGIQI